MPQSNFDELSGAVAHLVLYDGWGSVPDHRVAAADTLRRLAAATGHVHLSDLASSIAGPPTCLRCFANLSATYTKYAAEEVLGGTAVPSAETIAALRCDFTAVLQSQPRCPLEFGRKVKWGCTFGVQAKIKATWQRPGPDARQHYRLIWRELSPVEPWFLARVAGYSYSPAEWEFGDRGGDFIVSPGFIEELLQFAGPAWQKAIAADAGRLNGRAS